VNAALLKRRKMYRIVKIVSAVCLSVSLVLLLGAIVIGVASLIVFPEGGTITCQGQVTRFAYKGEMLSGWSNILLDKDISGICSYTADYFFQPLNFRSGTIVKIGSSVFLEENRFSHIYSCVGLYCSPE
jgi:hypothetical protein